MGPPTGFFAAINKPPPTAEEIARTMADAKAAIGNPDSDLPTILDKLNTVVAVSKHMSAEDVTTLAGEDLVHALRLFVLNTNKRIRVAALRTLRYMTKSKEFMHLLVAIHLDYCLVRSLERDKSCEAERLQALKLIRRFMELDCAAMPRCLVQSLIAIAEHADDNFKRVCLETLCEIAVRTPRLVAYCNGIRSIFASILEPSGADIIDSLVLTILYIMNDDTTRCFVRPRVELEILLSPFTDPFVVDGQEREARLNAARMAIVTMMKSWTGIMCLCADDMGLKSLVDALALPSIETKKIVLAMLYEIFRIPLPPSFVLKKAGTQKGPSSSSSSSSNNNNNNTNNANNINNSGTSSPATGVNFGRSMFTTGSQYTVGDSKDGLTLPPRFSTRHNLLNNYVAVLVIAFVQNGLIEALVEVGKGAHKDLAFYATLLLGEILYIANTLLPPAACARMQTLPTLVNQSAIFAVDPMARSQRTRASTMLNSLHQFMRTKRAAGTFYDIHLSILVNGANRWRRMKGLEYTTGTRSRGRAEEMKGKVDAAMDDPTFLSVVKDSNVLDIKDYNKWNWSVISELLDGLLQGSSSRARMQVCLKNKFIKRLCSFYKPEKSLFCVQTHVNDNTQYVRVMVQLLEVLLSSDEGFEYLKTNVLIPQIANVLRLETDPNSEQDQKRLFRREKMATTMAKEYFTFIGVLSGSARGQELMQRHKIWSSLYKITDLQGREDLVRLIITSLDYNLEVTHSRILLNKALRSSSKEIRFHATQHMKLLYRAGIMGFAQWGVDLLVTELYDPDPEVEQAALAVIDEACDDIECLNCLIDKRPSLLHMSYAGKNLMLRFLSTPAGFRYLSEMNAIEKEIGFWQNGGTVAYVNSIESALASSMNLAWESDMHSGAASVTAPPHLFGELSKTEEGCRLLDERAIVEESVKTIKSETAKSLHRRAALWTVGHVGATKLGYELLAKHGGLPVIVSLAQNSSCLSLRGTCFYVLGLISRSESSRKDLEALGWEGPSDATAGICVPQNVREFFRIPDYEYKGSWAAISAVDNGVTNATLRDKADVAETFQAVANLSNHITADGASRTLRRIKNKNPELFQQPAMIFEVYRLLEVYHFRLPVRRFIHEQLFDTNMLFTEDDFKQLSEWRPNNAL